MSQHRSETAKNRPLLSKRLLVLLLGFLYLLLSLTVLEAFRFRGEKPAAEAMREASERTAACFSAVKEDTAGRISFLAISIIVRASMLMVLT